MLEILYFADKDWISRFIRLRLHSPYSHSAIRVNGSIWESHWPAVRRVDGSEAVLYGKTSVARSVIQTTDEQIQRGITWANKQIGDKYDLVDFFALGLGFVANQPNHYICSTFVADFLTEAGVRTYVDPGAQTPQTLAEEWGIAPWPSTIQP